MNKKILTIALAAALSVSLLASCGGSDDTDTADTSSAAVTQTSSEGGVSDATFKKVQDIYATLVEEHNSIADAVNSGQLTLSGEAADAFNQAADLINEMGELEKSDFESEQDAVDIVDAMVKIEEVLNTVLDSADVAGEGISDEDFAAIQEAYASMLELHNTIVEAANSGKVELSAEATEAVNQAADIINEIGDLERSDIKSQKDGEDLLKAMSDIVDVLGAVVDSIQ